jgi:multiple antibiotic resistance protein
MSLNNKIFRRSAILIALTVVCFISVRAQANLDAIKSGYFESVPLSYIFTILFLTLGPVKIIGPFAKITEQADTKLAQKIALLGSLFSCIALLIAALLGNFILAKFDIPLSLLALSAGIILFIVALMAIIQQYGPLKSDEMKSVPTLKSAIMPLAFPNIVTPYGIALLIVFLALNPDIKSQLTIGAMILVIMVLNLILMIISRKFFNILGVLLAILGAVLGIVQVALGLKIIYRSLNSILHS